jgi:SAM-dependent methyltransferase
MFAAHVDRVGASGMLAPLLVNGRKALRLVREHGISTAGAVVASVVEDLYLRTFDRRYGVRTSGYIALSQTSLGAKAEARGHRYRAVNAYAFQRLLMALRTAPESSFVDLGCGHGRACLIAAQAGFARVRGVEMVPEFCAQARTNVLAFARREPRAARVDIILDDAVEYSARSDDDVVFLFNPVPREPLERMVDNLLRSAQARQRPLLMIYSQRVLETSPTLEVLECDPRVARVLRQCSWGQLFCAYQSRPQC